MTELRKRLAVALRQVTTWWLALAIVLVAIGALVDGGALAIRGAPLSIVVAGALVAASLGCLLAVVGALATWAMSLVVRRCADRWGHAGFFRLVVVTAITMVPVWILIDPFSRSGRTKKLAYAAIVGVTAGAVGLSAWLHSAPRPRLARSAAAVLGGLAVAADVWLWTPMYIELHMVACLVAMSAFLAVVAPVRRAAMKLSARTLFVTSVGAVGASLLVIPFANQVAPGWRSLSVRDAYEATRFADALRKGIDLDLDRSSAIAWGADCNDTDPDIHPLAPDPPGGGDSNCNGVDAPELPTDQDAGLALPFGSPHLPKGSIDLVLLITIDTLPADILVPELMPNLHRFASSGITFERTYAAGSKTIVSLPMAQKATRKSPYIATELEDLGIGASVVFGGGIDPRDWGFVDVTRTARDAEAVTDGILAKVGSLGEGPNYLWGHYFDPHLPTKVHSSVGVPEARRDLPASYRSTVRYTDEAFGRLIAALRKRGVLDRALVIVTGDHGEGFGRYQIPAHSVGGYDFILRVPGVLVGPGIEPGRYPHLVSHRGLPATIFGALGLEEKALTAEQFGRSWLRVRNDRRSPLHLFVVSGTYRFTSGEIGRSPARMIAEGKHKLVTSLKEHLFELYDLEADPEERHNLAPSRPAIANELRRKLATFVDLDSVR